MSRRLDPAILPLAEALDQRTIEGALYTKLTGNRVKCTACAHRCTILPGLDGICRVRSNRAGTLMVPHGYVAALQVDPIEKKPFFHFLPGSDALQLAMFVGYTVAGIPGGFVSLFAAILPPTIIMFGVVTLLHRIQREAWVSRFVEGLTPAVAVLILTVAWKIFRGNTEDAISWQSLVLGGAGLIALLLEVPAPLVLLACGIIGTFLF